MFFHLIEQLGHIALCDQQALGEVDLQDAFRCANVREDVELGGSEVPFTQLYGSGLYDPVADTREMQPCEDGGATQTGAAS